MQNLDVCIIANALEKDSVLPHDNWEMVKQFASTLVVTLDQVFDSLHVGIVLGGTFSSLHEGEAEVTPLQPVTNIIDTTNMITSLTYPGTHGGYFYDNIKIALSLARARCFGAEHDRPDVPNVVFLVIGIAPGAAVVSSPFRGTEINDFNQVREAGIKIISIGTSYADASFMKQVSLNGDSEDYSEVDSISLMSDQIQAVTTRALNISNGNSTY